MALRRIAQPVGNLTRFLRGLDMRHDDAKRAAVQNPGGEPELPGRNADDRRDSGAERGDRDLDRGVEVHRIVLEIEKQPVIAAGLHDRGDVDSAALAYADAERQFAGLEPFAGGVAKGGFHDVPPLVQWRFDWARRSGNSRSPRRKETGHGKPQPTGA